MREETQSEAVPLLLRIKLPYYLYGCERMKKKKWQHAKTVGNQTESIASEWLSKYNCKQEDTMRNTRTRSKGSIDFEGDKVAVEVKHFTTLLTSKHKSEEHDTKCSQIEYLNKQELKGKVSGLLITENNITFYFIPMNGFMMWWIDCNRKSINADIAKNIGIEIHNKQELELIIDRLLI